MYEENEIDILIATERDDYAAVEHLLKSGVSANTSNELGLTALHIAASKGNVKIIDLLISYYADVNASCTDGWTVLCEATKYNQLQIIEVLLSHGAKADVPKKWIVYETALRAKAEIKIFEILLAMLITPEADNNEITKIFEKAIQRDRHDVLDVIISICPSFSAYLDSQPKSKRIIRLELPVLVDLENSDDVLNAVLINGYKYEKLFKGGPPDITEEFVEIYHNSELIFSTIQPCNYYYPQPILNIKENLWEAGYYPRLAVLNPKLEITGLSHETGGWINATAYRYLDECPSYKWFFSIENSLHILPYLDSDEMAQSRKKELDIDRNLAIELGKSAVKICEQGDYFSKSGSKIDIANMLESARKSKNSIHFYDKLPTVEPKFFDVTNVQISNETTLGAAHRMIQSGLRPLALNFANGIYPGGGFLRGARAQEETLCRSSGLYQTLVNDQMYEYHRTRPEPDSSDWAILSTDVPVFRNDNSELLDEIWLLSFVTCAAPYAPKMMAHEARKLLCKRIYRVLSIAKAYGYTSLLLGAWGCGAFGNEPFNTASYFRTALEEDFRGSFSDVVFAITDWSEDRKFISPFKSAFHKSNQRF